MTQNATILTGQGERRKEQFEITGFVWSLWVVTPI